MSRKVKKNIPPPAKSHKTQSFPSNITSTVVEGMSFGVGSSIGHRLVDIIFSSSKQNEPKQVNYCEKEINTFKECMQNADVNNCKFYYDIIKQCEENKPTV